MTEPAVHVAALAVSAAGTAVLLAARSSIGLGVGAVLVGAGLAPLFPLLASMVVTCTERARPRAAGAIFSVGGMGAGAVPWLTGQIAGASGSMRTAFLVPAVGVMVMAVLLWRYRLLVAAPAVLSRLDESPRIS
jgi:fucose permease